MSELFCGLIRRGRRAGRSLARRFGAAAVLGGILWSSSGCNHLFYFPDRKVHARPDKFGLIYSEHTLVEADGTRIKVWHLLPQGQPRHGVILQMHGNAENMTTHFFYVGWLAAAGYDVVTFDYRGYGKSTGLPQRQGLLADAVTVIDWIKHQPVLRTEPLAVLGQSLGGAVAVPVVARSAPGTVQVLLLESTFDSYRDIAQTKLGDIWLTWPLQIPLSYLVSDEDSPVYDAGQLTLPLLMVHGDADPVVPLANARRIFSLSPTKDKEFWTVPGGGHLPAFGDPESPWRPRLLTYLCAHHVGNCSK